MSPNSVAVPREDSSEEHYHRLESDSCDAENYILSSVDSAYSERGLDPCPECNPPVPDEENAGDDSAATSTSNSSKETGNAGDGDDYSQDSISAEAQWGQEASNGNDGGGPQNSEDSQGDEPGEQSQFITDDEQPEGTQQGDSTVSGDQSVDSGVLTEAEIEAENQQAAESPNQTTASGSGSADEVDDLPQQDNSIQGSGDNGDLPIEESLIEETDAALDTLPEGSTNGNNPHLSDRVSPDEANPTNEGVLGIPNRTQDMAKFEFVMGEDDELGVENVDTAGMISLGNGRYAAISSVQPREWSVLEDSAKEQIVNTYKSAFLSPLDSPVEIVEYPSDFDISEHLAKIKETQRDAEGDPSANPLVQAGREVYPKWLKGFINRNGMKQRKFYMIVTISEDQINQFGQGEATLLGGLRDRYPVLDSVMARIKGEEEDETETRQKCLRELHTRTKRLQGGLRRLNVGSERLDDRDEVMEVLYEYFNNSTPRVDEFQTDQITTRSPATNE